jgi:hypothetical protein
MYAIQTNSTLMMGGANMAKRAQTIAQPRKIGLIITVTPYKVGVPSLTRLGNF